MKNDREVYFISEKTGYAQLYAVPFDGGEPRALTTGKWEVLNVRQSKDKSKFYLIANAEGPSDQFLYEMPGEGGPLTRISQAPGKHTAVLSPDETLYRRRLLVHQQTAGPLRPGEPSAAGSQAAHHFTRAGVRAIRLAGLAHRDGAGARRRQSAGAPVQAREISRRAARRSSSSTARGICRTWIISGPLTTTNTCSITCWRSGASWCSMWTIAAPPATAATGAPPSTSTWAARIWTISWTPRNTRSRNTAPTRKRSASTAAATAGLSP